MTNSSYSCLTTFIASKCGLLFKRKLKTVVLFVLLFSVVFLTYQFLNYSSLSNFQHSENLRRINFREFLRSKPKSGDGSSYHQLKNLVEGLGNRDKLKEQLKSKNKVKGQFESSKGLGGGKPIFSDHVVGVAPEAQKFYIKQQQQSKAYFSCLTSGKQISWDKVNDDFCDCPFDGSDEPSTSACMNGRFFCSVVKAGFPEYVPSAFVNDGICDCLDGSDEHQRMSSISCKNRA